jgi:hypothetical protein
MSRENLGQALFLLLLAHDPALPSSASSSSDTASFYNSYVIGLDGRTFRFLYGRLLSTASPIAT